MAVLPAELERLVDDVDPGVDGHHVEQRLDVLGIEAHAAGRGLHADAGRTVGAVDQVGAARNGQAHRTVSERIVRTRWYHGRQDLALSGTRLTHRLRRVPGRVLHLLRDARDAEGRVPVHLANGDRIAVDHRLLTARRRDEVIEAVLGQVDDDARARRLRQDALLRQVDRHARARQPGIDTRIRLDDFLVAQAVGTGDVEQGVLMARLDDPRLAHQIAAVHGQGEHFGGGRHRAGNAGQEQQWPSTRHSGTPLLATTLN